MAGSSNPFLSRLLNRDTITRISYKSKSLVHWGEGMGSCVCTGGEFKRGPAPHSSPVLLQMMPTFFKT